jgi:hypothetical protein
MTPPRDFGVKFCVEETGILALYSVIDLCSICANNIRAKVLQISYVLFMYYTTPDFELKETVDR